MSTEEELGDILGRFCAPGDRPDAADALWLWAAAQVEPTRRGAHKQGYDEGWAKGRTYGYREREAIKLDADLPELTEAEVAVAIETAQQKVPCPQCHAAAGEECSPPVGHPPERVLHLDRKALAIVDAREGKADMA